VALVVLMPDHLHAILSVFGNRSLESTVSSWKRLTAKRLKILWQRGFFDHRLRSESSAQQKWNYVSMNPVRSGFVERPEDWPYRFTTRDFERMLH
jgi:REP element-mobilizing transposase RayT